MNKKDVQEMIEAIVKDVILIKRDNPDIDMTPLESKIDNLVYHLYGLTEKEIRVVEGGR